MKLAYNKPFRSIVAPVTAEELNDFVVVTGPNGSGKSQLLEAIASGSLTVDDVTTVIPENVRLYSINQLLVPNDGPLATNSLAASWQQFKTTVDNVAQQIHTERPALDADVFEAQLRSRLVENNNVLTSVALDDLAQAVGKRVSEFTQWDFQNHAPLIFNRHDPFQLSITEVFLSYRGRYLQNGFQQFLLEKGEAASIEPLSDEEFVTAFGPPPWTLLDSTLEIIGLEYKFVPPEGVAEHTNYQAKLRHTETGVEITTDLLSSGEKTLLALAMSLYTGSKLGESVRLPKVLLLDEPDASLHPAMVQSLLRVIRETFLDTHGVKVLLTTHSPTTVALAPEESLYVMRRNPDPRLTKTADRDQALSSLTVGLSTLSVKIDNRRTVFVESEHDEIAYQELFRLVRSKLNTDLSLDFVASGRGGQGNCEAVKYLVGKLRSAGNNKVRGIVDRDGRGGAGTGVVFNPERYSIENLVYDPLVFGAFLLREGIVKVDQLGLEKDLRHYDLESHHAQAIIDAVVTAVGDLGIEGGSTQVEYVGGFSADVPSQWLTIRGHDLENKLVDTYPPLKGIGRRLLPETIQKGYGDLPEFIPSSALRMFEDLLRD
jgi:energy-coupling factor transporter ATP-binding protein EcfA2